MKLTYSNYLRLEELLDLQTPRSTPPEHDEYLFIVIHQTYELWFRLVLLEFEKISRDFSAGDLYGAIHTARRARTILKTLVGQFDILETMTPMSFTSFRDRLETASGFQSYQFREIEFYLGYKRPEILDQFEPGSPARTALERRLAGRTLVDHFYDFLGTQGLEVPGSLKNRPVEKCVEASAELQEILFSAYRSRPDLAGLFELLTDIDEGFQEWRYRHVKIVERTIGNKYGTGGSLGVDFLKRTLFRPFFADLWAIRHRF